MVSPGLTTGVLTLNKFSNTNSTLSIDINGPGIAGTDRDSLKITGTPTSLGGNLEIKLGSGYIPDSASQFCIASLPAGYGPFGTLTSIGLPSDTMGWKIIYNPTSIFVKYCPVWYADTDGDGYGDFNNNSKFCDCVNNSPGYSRKFTDCNDNNVLINPGATEICNGLDDDCDGGVDEGVQNTYFADTDNDGYGDATVTTMACSPPSGYVTDNTDCNDNNVLINPGATEICNGLDDDCDGGVDEGAKHILCRHR
ncbi:MAG: putative metal-binding motif-containing protein [Saprospiraceae bacterium]|nr:putative metal-binding motif-containing protein [Saprospiraceae bacterium]